MVEWSQVFPTGIVGKACTFKSKRMKFATVLLGFVIVCFGFQCDKEYHGHCTVLHDALLVKDEIVLTGEINYLLEDLVPNPGTGDPIGHAINLGVFIDRLRNICDFNADLGCYACIETYPPQSEVYIMLDSLGTNVTRVLDIATPDSIAMTFRGLH